MRTLFDQSVEVSARHRDGHAFPVSLSVAPIWVDDTWIFNAFLDDSIEPKLRERQLEEHQLELEAANATLVAADGPTGLSNHTSFH